MRVIKGCKHRKDWQGVSDLVWAVRDYMYIQGYWIEIQTVLETGVKAAKESGDRYDEGAFLNSLAVTYTNLGQVEKARKYFQQSITIFKEIKSPYADLARKLLADLDKPIS